MFVDEAPSAKRIMHLENSLRHEREGYKTANLGQSTLVYWIQLLNMHVLISLSSFDSLSGDERVCASFVVALLRPMNYLHNIIV